MTKIESSTKPIKILRSLTPKETGTLLRKIPGWRLSQNKTIYRELNMKNFLAAVDLIKRIAKIAESQNHHPDIHLTDYRKLRIELTTHDANGVSELDFIQAAKINQLPVKLKN